jgi:hypothetical protein
VKSEKPTQLHPLKNVINRKLKDISYEAAAEAWPHCIVNEGYTLFKQQYRNVKFSPHSVEQSQGMQLELQKVAHIKVQHNEEPPAGSGTEITCYKNACLLSYVILHDQNISQGR